jgi:hypothetical protein
MAPRMSAPAGLSWRRYSPWRHGPNLYGHSAIGPRRLFRGAEQRPKATIFLALSVLVLARPQALPVSLFPGTTPRDGSPSSDVPLGFRSGTDGVPAAEPL